MTDKQSQSALARWKRARGGLPPRAPALDRLQAQRARRAREAEAKAQAAALARVEAVKFDARSYGQRMRYRREALEKVLVQFDANRAEIPYGLHLTLDVMLAGELTQPVTTKFARTAEGAFAKGSHLRTLLEQFKRITAI